MLLYIFITDAPIMVPNVTFLWNVNVKIVTLTLSWGEPFNNYDPIVNYTVSCSDDVTCPPNFTTTDNNTRIHTVTNLTLMTNYTFSVVATNSIGSGEAGVVMIVPGMLTYVLILRIGTYIHEISIYTVQAGICTYVCVFLKLFSAVMSVCVSSTNISMYNCMLNKNTQGAKKGEANQKQQLSSR